MALDLQDITSMRKAVGAGIEANDVVQRGYDGRVATDVDRGQVTLYGENEVNAFNEYLKQRNTINNVETQQEPVQQAESVEGNNWYVNNQVNAWKKFYATEEDNLVEAKKISEKTGIPENLILNNDDSFEQARNIFAMQQKNVDMEKVFKENPSLAKLAQYGNDTMAAIAMNHLDEIKEQKSLIQTIQDQLRVAEIQNELNLMGRAEMDGGAAIDFEKVKKLQEELVSLKGPSFTDDPLGAIAGGVAGQAGQMYRSTLKGIERGTQLGAAGALYSGAVGAAAGGVGAVPGAIAGASTGFAWGMRVGYFEGSYNEMVGSNYLELRSERNADGTYKYSMDQARSIAAAQALASAGIETFTFGKVTQALGNAKGVFAREVKDIVKNATSKEAGYYALLDWSKNVAKVTFEESKEEGLQSISDDLIRNAGDLIFGKAISNSGKDILKNAFENFSEAVPASAGFGLIGAGGAATSATIRKTARALQLNNQNKFSESKTGKGIELVSALKENIAKSKLFKTDKDTATEVLKHNLEGTGFENVYVDSAELRQAGENELLSKVVDSLDLSDEKKQAILEGKEEIKSSIPTETFMQIAVEADDKLSQYISFEENAFSFAKNKRYAEIMKKEIDALKNVDLKEQKEIESIILENGFAPEEREAAERYINEYGFSDAGRMVNVSLKAVNNKINEIVNRNSPDGDAILYDESSYYKDVTGIHKGLGYYVNQYENNRILDEGEISSDIAEELKTYNWVPYEAKQEPGWLQRWRNNNSGRFTKEAERNLIIDSVLGKNNGDIWQAAPENLQADRAALANLLEEQQQLEKLKAGFAGIANNEAIVTRGLSKEGYQAYRTILEQLKNASPEAREAAQFSAVLLARHADRYAETVREFTGNKEYTALDYIENVTVDAEGKNTRDDGFKQAAMKKHTFASMQDFADAVNNAGKNLPKIGNWIQTTRGKTVIIPGSSFAHIQKDKHPLTIQQWENLVNNLENIVEARTDNRLIGSNHGYSVQTKIKATNGDFYGVIFEIIPTNGKVLLTNAVTNSEAGIDNWLKNKKSSQALDLAKYQQDRILGNSLFDIILKSINDVNGINTFNQISAENARGKISFQGDKSIISLFEAADQSSFAHEMGHLFLKDLERLAAMEGVPEQVVKDYETVKAWTNYNPKQLEEYSGTATYREFEARHKAIQKAMRDGDTALVEKLKYEWEQERWARGWEQYLREGKAPTSSLQRVFRTFKKWLTGIYRDFMQVGGAPSPEVKAVMDRMIATQDEIDLQAERASHASFIRAGGLNFLAENNQELFQKYWAQAQEEAAEKVLKVAMQDVKDNMAKEREELIASIRESIVEDADNNDVLTISRMVEEEPSALDVCLDTAQMTKEEYEAELKRLGGSYDNYIKQQLDAQVKELGNITEVEYENIKAMAEQAIENGEYSDKLYEFEVAAMMQKGAIEERIGKMADDKFAAIEKALSGIDAKENPVEKVNALQRTINDLRYTIRWNEAETDMLLKIQKAADKAKARIEKAEAVAKAKADEKAKADARLEKEKAQHKQDVKEAEYNGRWREAELNFIIEEEKGKLREQIDAFNKYRKEQREGLRVVRDAEKGWIADTRKYINNLFSTDYSIKEIGGERKNRSEARSHRYESMQLMAKGEWQAAAEEKRAEVISNIMADLARKAEKQLNTVETGLKKKLKTLQKNDHIAANQRYLFQMLMQSFGYAENAEYQAPSEWTNANQLLMEMANAGYEMDFYDLLGQPMVERDGNNNVTNINLPEFLTRAMNGEKINPQDLSMAELRDFNNFMKMLYKSGSKQMVLDKDGKKIELDAAGAAIRAQANERMAKIQEVGKGKAHQEETKRQWFARLARKVNANILQTETVLDMMGPLAHDLVYQRIADASMNELRALGETTQKLQKLMDETLGANSKEFLKGKYKFGEEVIDGSELLAIALNCGTQSNKARVISSFNATEQQISEALSNLSENEWKFVEGVWAMFEENWPKITEVQIAITGGMAKKEQAYGFYIKGKDGQMRYIKGGYYPIRYDNKQGTRTRQLEASNNIRAASNTAAGKNTGTGFTKERAKNVSDQVLSTNLGLVSSMLSEQVHFIHMRQAYLDARAVVNNKEFKNAVIEQFGSDMQSVMENWVESQWADPRPASEMVDQAGRWARTALTLGALSFRVTTALINVANIATVNLYLGPQNTMKALHNFYRPDGNIAARKNEILSKSVFLAQRAEVFDANIRENVKKSVGVGKWNKMQQQAQDLLMFGFKPIMLTDMMLALPTWQFEYERVIREADPTKKTAEQIEADAIRAGDKAVRRCFGSGMKQDITRVQRGSEFTKMLTTFYSYFAVVHNLVASKVAEGRRNEYQGKGAIAKWAPIANAVLCEYIIQSLIDSAVRQGMNAIGEDEWDWEKFWKKSATNVADNMFGAIPGLRDIVPRFLESMMGERVQDVRIPLIDVGQKAINVATDIKNDKKDKIDVAYDCAKLLSVTSGFSDPLLNAVPTTMRYISEYEKQDLFEYLKAVLLSKKLKSKDK